MTPYVLSQIPSDEVDLFQKIKLAVNELPDIDLGLDDDGKEIILSCHILARAVAKVFGLKPVDGHFYPNFQHTWLLTPHRHIIDVYPVAILGGPILIDGQLSSPASWIYKKKRLGLKKSKKPSFLRAIKVVAKSIKDATERSSA